MGMKSMPWMLLLFSTLVLAQSPADKAAPDGARPSDGAIKGGSIVPGETAGTPDGRSGSPAPAARGVERCNELSGSLREQCLAHERDAASGASQSPAPAATPRSPGEPPPQNPR